MDVHLASWCSRGCQEFVARRISLRAQRNAKLEELQTVEAVRGSLTDTVGATGTVRANQPA